MSTAEVSGPEFVDDVAVERCVAGTLPGGAGMSQAEKELAVLRLHERGYPNQEITRRAGVSVRDLRPILRRHHHRPDTTTCYQPTTPVGCTPEQARQVRLLVVSRVEDRAQARAMLLALGLVAVVARAAGEATP